MVDWGLNDEGKGRGVGGVVALMDGGKLILIADDNCNLGFKASLVSYLLSCQVPPESSGTFQHP
jgi:hypothetical protein